jgi:antitoxin (DNA-binding transcriptional repressor) of toxin-antitoxin stability system
MARMKTVGVRHLKDELSAYLREVRSGSIVLITDRGTVIAELRQPSIAQRPPSSDLLEDWVRDGRLSAPRTAKARCPRSPVKVPTGAAASLLDQERAE